MSNGGPDTIGFVLLGGEHQLLHIVPVAAALSREPGVRIELFAATEALAGSAASLMLRLGSGRFGLTELRLPRGLETFARDTRTGGNLKLPRLAWHLARLRRCTVLVTAERTSTALRRLPGRNPLMIHLRHGAGDRAVGFERRIALFDHLIVAGEKDRRRVIAERLLPAARCHACGYIKMAALQQLDPAEPELFTNGRPTVLYNPHFEQPLSSWHRHGRAVIDAVVQHGGFNLIVAPHVRLFAAAGAEAWSEWEKLSVPGRVIIDLGSPRSYDMTYTRCADIYLGDVSSQIYEFVARPRPCVFINSHEVRWHADPNYTMWHMGEVVPGDTGAIVAALERAPVVHAPQFRALQQQRVAETLGDTGADCARRAARVILDAIAQQGRVGVPVAGS